MIVVRGLRARMRVARRRMRKNARSGSSIIEFAVVAPVLLLFICGIIETGVIFYGQSTLFYATADATRMVRTGQITGAVNATTIRTQICSRISGLISTAQCNANLKIDMRTASSFGSSSYPSVTNSNGTINSGALNTSSNISACQIVLIRSFYPWAIMTPLMRPLLKTASDGTHLLYAAAAFRTEPYNNSPC
jgi:Flp pilus assembly protein TadG